MDSYQGRKEVHVKAVSAKAALRIVKNIGLHAVCAYKY